MAENDCECKMTVEYDCPESFRYLGLTERQDWSFDLQHSFCSSCFPPFELLTVLRLPFRSSLYIFTQRMSSSTASIQPTISISNPPNPGSEEAAVLAVVEALLDAVPSKDSAKLLSYFHPDCSAARMRGPELLVETLETVFKDVSAMEGELWERFIEPDVKVCFASQLAAYNL